MRRLLVILLVMPALMLAGCGSDSADDTAASPSASVADGFTSDAVTVTGEPGSEPTVTIDTAATPPDQLVVKEITAGDGPAIGPNSLVSVQYVGSSWSTGEVFQSSWTTGAAEFPIKGVIPGWQEGLQGVTEGSRVLLIIPPELAYGSNPPPGSGIVPDETLTFVVDVEKVSS
jgi:peptidylprolyl isomerase